MHEQGNLYVIAAPSGTGKTTLVHALVESMQKITVSISHTTRAKRPLEEHGINYYFVDDATFQRLINENDFLEYAVIFNHHYGTSKKWVQETLAAGVDVILEIDWQGHQQIRKMFPRVTSIFILPPTPQDLKKRLQCRNQDHTDTINKRLKDAEETVSHLHEFDYLIINDDFERALEDLRTIIKAGRLITSKQLVRHEKMINDFGKF